MDIQLHQHTPTVAAVDSRGLVVRVIAYSRFVAGQDPEARITRSAYNAASRVIAQWDARFWASAGGDGKGLGLEVFPPPNQTMAYDLAGAMFRTESVDAGWRIGLAADAGQALVAWDGRGTQRRMEYDDQLRPVSVHEQLLDEPSRCVERFTYGGVSEAVRNRCGRLLQHNDAGGVRHFPSMGVFGQSLSEVQQFLVSLESPDWEDANQSVLEDDSYVTRWSYDALDAVLTQTDAVGNLQSKLFDLAGQTAQVSFTTSSGPEQVLVSEIAYNAQGQVEAQRAGNDVFSTARYSAADGRLIQLRAHRQADNHTLQSLFYAFDPVGNVEHLEDLAQPTQWFDGQQIEPVSTFRYDSLYQLIEASGRESVVAGIGPALPSLGGPGGTADASRLRNYTQKYTYDAGGNLTRLIHQDNGGQVLQHRTMAVDEHSNRSLLWPENTPLPDIAAGFDANGNQQRLGGQTLLWNERNQLKRVVQLARDGTANLGPEDEEQYVYGGGGLRLRKVRTTWTGTVTHTGEVRYLPGLELHRHTATGQVYAVAAVQAGRVAVRHLHWTQGLPVGLNNSQYRYSLDDHLSSSALELDHKGQVISHEGYHPYGGTAWRTARSGIEAHYKTIRYSGKERDATGLNYFGFRYYAPWLQRWINPDPAGGADGLNLYSLVKNNPTTFVDADGRIRLNFSEAAAVSETSEIQQDDYKIVIDTNIDFLYRADTRSPEEIQKSGGFSASASMADAGSLGRFLGGEPLEPILFTAETEFGMKSFANRMPGQMFFYKIDAKGYRIASYTKNFESRSSKKNLVSHLKKQVKFMSKVIGVDWREKSDSDLKKILTVGDGTSALSWMDLTTEVQEAHLIGEKHQLWRPEQQHDYEFKMPVIVPWEKVKYIGSKIRRYQ